MSKVLTSSTVSSDLIYDFMCAQIKTMKPSLLGRYLILFLTSLFSERGNFAHFLHAVVWNDKQMATVHTLEVFFQILDLMCSQWRPTMH